MDAAIALPTGSNIAQPARAEVLARYRHLREISKAHHTKAFDFLSPAALMQQARRLGLADGRKLILDSSNELDLVSDLVIHTAEAGRSRAIDRYARNAPPPAGSDEALVLDAMRNARFAVLSVEARHPAVGLLSSTLSGTPRSGWSTRDSRNRFPRGRGWRRAISRQTSSQ